jgi:hypothetical protein
MSGLRERKLHFYKDLNLLFQPKLKSDELPEI